MHLADKIYLIGLPGSGKSTLGKKLALQTSYEFVDLDHYIAEQEQAPVSQIFKEKGEAYFRALETKALQQLADRAKLIVATGGGTPCFNNNMGLMKQNGVTVFMDLPVELIEQRLNKAEIAVRPLFAGNVSVAEKLQELAASRRKFYLQADIILPADECNAEMLKQRLISR